MTMLLQVSYDGDKWITVDEVPTDPPPHWIRMYDPVPTPGVLPLSVEDDIRSGKITGVTKHVTLVFDDLPEWCPPREQWGPM